MLIKELRRKIDNPEIAVTVISLVLNCSKSQVLAGGEISNKDAKKCMKIVKKYKKGSNPIAYQTGLWYFYGLPMSVNKNVLIPRFDTEVLVESVLNILERKDMITDRPKKILDLCTGSGCITVALAYYGNSFIDHITASDISASALRTAQKNAKKNLVGDKITFIKSNMFDKIKGKFDMVVSNPPYVKTCEVGAKDKSVLREPFIALDGGADGLNFYRIIAENVKEYLEEKGVIALEIGYDQGNKIKPILENAGFKEIEIIKDLNKNNRVIIGKIQ